MMSKGKRDEFTGGAWRADGHTVYVGDKVVGCAFRRGDDEFDGVDERAERGAAGSESEAQANAQLMAQAPQLLAAVALLLAATPERVRPSEFDIEKLAEARAWASRALRDAIRYQPDGWHDPERETYAREDAATENPHALAWKSLGTYPTDSGVVADLLAKCEPVGRTVVRCSVCHCVDVQMIEWVDPNRGEVVEDDPFISDMHHAASMGWTFCFDCGDEDRDPNPVLETVEE